MYALYGYMYAASLCFILRGRCDSRAARIGYLGCMNAYERPCWLLVRFLQAWLDCMYALHSYRYAASLFSMLRYTCACRAACIGSSWLHERPCGLLVRFWQAWLDCMYALYGYMYSGSLLFILRGRCTSRAARIGLLGCMHALAGFLCASEDVA
jgi:hypothetical protein